jgi:hypothetical protein
MTICTSRLLVDGVYGSAGELISGAGIPVFVVVGFMPVHKLACD